MKKDLLHDTCLEVDTREYPDGKTNRLLEIFESDRLSFASLIDSKPNEARIQTFLEEHPVILLQAMLDGFYPAASIRSSLFSKVQLGSQYEVDFAYCNFNSMGLWWTFVELERPDVLIFNRHGDPSKYLTHAIRQVLDWQAWVSDHVDYARAELGKLANETLAEWGWNDLELRRPCNGLIIIGRRSSLTPDTNRRRAQISSEYPNLEVVTYDRLFDPYFVGKDDDLDGSKDEMRTSSELFDGEG